MPGTPDFCAVQLTTVTERRADGTWDVIARAHNQTATALDASVPVLCSGGPAAFQGISRYDFYGTCAMGPCVSPPTGRRALRIPARGTVEIARARVDPRGGTCNAALAPGRYPITFSVDLQVSPEARVCSASTADVDVAGAAPPHRPPAPRPAPPPAPHAPCPKMPTCGIGCAGPMAHDANGCLLCACENEKGF